MLIKNKSFLTFFFHYFQSRDKMEHSMTFAGLLFMQNKLKQETRPVIGLLNAANIRTPFTHYDRRSDCPAPLPTMIDGQIVQPLYSLWAG
jgi:hypothetical protein